MDNLEQKIRALLDEEDRKFDSYVDDEPGILFRRSEMTMRTVRRYAFLWHIVSTILLIATLQIACINSPIYFSSGIIAIMITMGLCVVKLWYWICFTRFSISKEIKRLELQIVELTKQLEKTNNTQKSNAD